LWVERDLSAVFHGELDHVRLRSDAVQVARLLLAKRRGEPGDRVRGGLLLRTEVCSPFGSREAPGGFPGNEGCAVAAGEGGRSHSHREGRPFIRLSDARRAGRLVADRNGGAAGPG